jgi:hypothetical protein
MGFAMTESLNVYTSEAGVLSENFVHYIAILRYGPLVGADPRPKGRELERYRRAVGPREHSVGECWVDDREVRPQ